MSVILTAPQIARLQAAITSYLPDTAQVLRNALVSNGRGGQVENFQPSGAPVPCLLIQWAGRTGGDEAFIQNRFNEEVRYKLVVPVTTDITSKDRVTVTTNGTVTRTFEIKAVLPESWEVQRQVILVERESG